MVQKLNKQYNISNTLWQQKFACSVEIHSYSYTHDVVTDVSHTKETSTISVLILPNKSFLTNLIYQIFSHQSYLTAKLICLCECDSETDHEHVNVSEIGPARSSLVVISCGICQLTIARLLMGVQLGQIVPNNQLRKYTINSMSKRFDHNDSRKGSFCIKMNSHYSDFSRQVKENPPSPASIFCYLPFSNLS